MGSVQSMSQAYAHDASGNRSCEETTLLGIGPSHWSLHNRHHPWGQDASTHTAATPASRHGAELMSLWPPSQNELNLLSMSPAFSSISRTEVKVRSEPQLYRCWPHEQPIYFQSGRSLTHVKGHRSHTRAMDIFCKDVCYYLQYYGVPEIFTIYCSIQNTLWTWHKWKSVKLKMKTSTG